MKLTAVFRKIDDMYVGYTLELPGANTQGKTLEEARRNLHETVEGVLDANRTMAESDLPEIEGEIIREELIVA